MGETVTQLISAADIDRRLDGLAAEIARDYAGKQLMLLGVLKGAVIFMADLARKLTLNAEFAFIKLSSYGGETVSGGVKLHSDIDMDITGKHILIVEDIVDTGYSLAFLRRHVAAQNPASLRVCVLLDKPARRETPEAVFDYLGFTIPDKFVVGYGLDYAQRYRGLPYIGELRIE